MKILLSGGGTGGSITPLLAIAEEIIKSVETVDFLWVGTRNWIEKAMVDNFNKSQNSTSSVPSQSPAPREGYCERNPASVPADSPRQKFCGAKHLAGDFADKLIKFKAIHSGKLRRYFDLRNFIDPFFIILGFAESLWIIIKFKPDMIITAGSFVAVPVVWAGRILHVPVLVHQQDVEIGLANKLMSPFADIITCSLRDSVTKFERNTGGTSQSHPQRIYFTGNAIRRKILEARPPLTHSIEGEKTILSLDRREKREVLKKIKSDKDLPTLLVLGGGTGAFSVNKIIVQCLSELTKMCNIVHVTGAGKNPLFATDVRSYKRSSERMSIRASTFGRGLGVAQHYCQYPFLNNIEEIFFSVDLVISRCGMAFLSELSVLGKPSILIPIPDSHQEANTKYFADRNAAIVLDQKKLTPEILISTVRELLRDENKMRELSENISKIMPRDGVEKIAEIILNKINRR